VTFPEHIVAGVAGFVRMRASVGALRFCTIYVSLNGPAFDRAPTRFPLPVS
jgi:hypothetical protein